MLDKLCDLCSNEMNEVRLPSSILDGIEGLNKMCPECNDRLSATLTEARKFIHKYINDKLVEEADAIRAEVANE